MTTQQLKVLASSEMVGTLQGQRMPLNLILKSSSIDPFEELDPMITNDKDAFEVNVLRIIAITCLSGDDLANLSPNDK